MIVTVMVVGFAFVASTASADCSLGSTTLKYGSTGTAVTCLQETLNLDSSYPRGYFGNVTKNLVVSFQAANGLTADGVVGPLTKAALSVAPVYTYIHNYNYNNNYYRRNTLSKWNNFGK